MKVGLFHSVVILLGVLIFIAVLYSGSNGYLNKSALFYALVGLLTFIGIFYSVLWSQGFQRVSKLERVLDRKKNKKIQQAVNKYNKNKGKGSEIFSDLSTELNEYEFVERKLDINRLLLYNVISYIVTILLFILLPAEYFLIIQILFSICIILTVTLITTLFFIRDFEKRGDIE